MDFRSTEEQQILRRPVREFAEAEIGPYVMEWDEARHFPHELLPKLAQLGLMGIQFPEEDGGASMSAVEYCICIAELARVDPSIVLCVAAHNGLCSAHLYMFGTRAQRQRYLTHLARGETLGAWGLTEPSAGSDAAGTRTMAMRKRSDWVLNGSKTFATHGSLAGVMVAMTTTDPAKGHRGISACIIERETPGMTAGKKENKLGMRASDTAEVVFQDCEVGTDQLLGKRARAWSTRCRFSTRAALASRHSPWASPRVRTKALAPMPPSVGSSANPSRRSRPSSGSSRIWRRGSRPPAC